MLTDATDGARDDLLAGVLSWSRARGAASVYVSCLAPRHGEGLWRLGFVERPEEWEKPVVVRSADAAGAHPAEWDLTLGDEDYN